MEVLTNLIERLEVVADQLEIIEANKQEEPVAELPKIKMPPVLEDFDKIVSGSLAKYLDLSRSIGGDVEKHSSLVLKSFEELRALIAEASNSAKPSNSVCADKFKPLITTVEDVIKFKDDNRASKAMNNLQTISEIIPALGWVTITPKPAEHVKNMIESGTFYLNRVLKEFKGKDDTQVEWTKSVSAIFSELEKYVKTHHPNELSWSGTATNGGGPLPPPPPPPPPYEESDQRPTTGGDSQRAALFSELNKGSSVTSGLRKVTDDMKTHKNPNLRAGTTVPNDSSSASNPPPIAVKPKTKPPVFEQRGNKWCIENFVGKKDITVEIKEIKESIYIYNCTDSVIQVTGKLNSIVMDNCKKTGVVFESVISCVDLINCRSVQMQVLNKVASVNIDKCDGVQLYISEGSKDVEVVYSKSSEMNMLIPGVDGDCVEYPIPEQFKCKFDGTKVHSEPNKSC